MQGYAVKGKLHMTGPELKTMYMILLSSLVYFFHPLYSGPLSLTETKMQQIKKIN